MPTDNFGRQVDPVSQSDLASGMLSSTQNISKQVGDALIQIVNSIKSQNAENKKLADKVNALLKQNSSLNAKIETFSKNVIKSVDEGRRLNEKIKNASKSKSHQPLSEQSLKRALKDHSLKNTDSFKQVQSIKKILYSKNTVCVEVKGFKKFITNQMKSLQSLNDSIKVGNKQGRQRGKKQDRTIEGMVVAEETMGIPTKEGIGIPSDEGFGIPSEEKMKKATKEAQHFASNEQIAAKFAHSVLHDKRLTSKILGETNLEHKEYLRRLQQVDVFGLKEGKINEKLVEIEAKRMDLASQYSKAQQKHLKNLKERVRLSVEGSEEEKKAIQDVFEFVDKTNKNITKKLEQQEHHVNKMSIGLEKLKQKASGLAETLQLTPIVNRWNDLTGNVVKNQVEWVQQIRQTAFQQGQVTHVLEDQKDLNDAIARTGKSSFEVKKQYLKNLHKGLKDEKIALKLSEQGMGLSTLIGSNAEQTSETVREWNMRFALSIDKVSTLSREVRNVAIETGVVGDDLIQAVKSTEKVMLNMRNLGTLTAQVAAQLIKLNAAAGKFGVAEEMQEITSALTGGMDNFMKLEGNMKNFLFKAARRAGVANRDIIFGTLDEDQVKNVFKGIGEIYQEKLRSMGANTVEDLSKAQLQSLQVWSKMYGFNIGQLEQINKAQMEANKDYTTKLKELQDEKAKYDEKNLTKVEKANFAMREVGLKFNESSRLLEKVKQGKLGEISGKGKALENLLGKQSFANKEEATKALLQNKKMQIEASRDAAKELGVAETHIGRVDEDMFNKAMTGDQTALKSIGNQMDEAMRQTEIGIQGMNDPITETNRTLEEIRNTLENKIAAYVPEIYKLLTYGGIGLGVASLGMKGLSLGKNVWNLAGNTGLGGALSGAGGKALQMSKGLGGKALNIGKSVSGFLGRMFGIVPTTGGFTTPTTGPAGSLLAKGGMASSLLTEGGAAGGAGILTGFMEKYATKDQEEKFYNWISKKLGWDTKENTAEKTIEKAIVPPAKAVASATSHRDIEERVREARATVTPKAESDALIAGVDGVGHNTKVTVEQLKLLTTQMTEFLNIVKQTNHNSPNTPIPPALAKSLPPPNFYDWRSGSYRSNPNKGPIIS